jgi:hypothetical protein
MHTNRILFQNTRNKSEFNRFYLRFDLILYQVSYDSQSYLTPRFDNKLCYLTFDQLEITNSRSVTNYERYARFGYV